MAKTSILKDRQGNEILPITTTDCVITSSGKSLKEVYATKQYADEAAADILNSSPEQLQVINTLGEKLADDENVASAVTKTVADAKMQLFIDMWNEACKYKSYSSQIETFGRYNEETGFFELNGITDITYEEALSIYRCRQAVAIKLNDTRTYNTQIITFPVNVRTLFPFQLPNANNSLLGAFGQLTPNFKLRHLRLFSGLENGYEASNITNLVSGNRGMTHLFGKINLKNITDPTKLTTPFNLTSIIEFDFYGLKCDFPICTTTYKDVAYNGSLNSYILLVSQALNTTPITITVANKVYSKLIGEGDYSDGNGTREEWLALNELAISKQITFATV